MEALASGGWLTRERVQGVAIISAVASAAMLLFLWLARHGTVDYFGLPIGPDFTSFWHAGRFANSGEAARAWDPDTLNAAIQATHGVTFETAWPYPPVFLMVAAPLAALPYLPALLVWQLLSLVAITLTLRPILGDRSALFVALASPIIPMVLAHGQNSLLTASLLGSGLLLLDRRPGLAGGFFGALLYKPQLGLMVAPLLLLTRSWRAILVALLSGAALVGASLLLWGQESWRAFEHGLGIGRFHMEQGAVGFYKSASLFAAARQWGASIDLAYAVQTVGALCAVGGIWLARNARPNVRAAAVCAGAALSTPYLLDYDMAVVGLGGVFLYAEAKRSGFLRFEQSALALIWAAPWISRWAAEMLSLPLAQVSTILLACFALRRIRSRHGHAAVDVQSLPGDVAGLPAR